MESRNELRIMSGENGSWILFTWIQIDGAYAPVRMFCGSFVECEAYNEAHGIGSWYIADNNGVPFVNA